MTVTEVVLDKVVVHPLVLLSVVDHFSRLPDLLKRFALFSSFLVQCEQLLLCFLYFRRMGKIGNQKRVVGLLLGSWSSKGILDIANSFAIPFDEDDKDRDVWFLDHEYLETMYSMFRFGYFSFAVDPLHYIFSQEGECQRTRCWLVPHRAKTSPE